MKKNVLFSIFCFITVIAFLNFVLQLTTIQFSCEHKSNDHSPNYPLKKSFAGAKRGQILSRINDISLIGKGDFCVTWDINVDDWWTNHPEYYIKEQNITHQCFSKILLPKKIRFMTEMHRIQNHLPCNNYTSRFLWNSGWGADLGNLMVGLYKAFQEERPFVVSFEFVETWPFWHYASLKPNGSSPVCSTKDLECYFLRLNGCNIISTEIIPRVCLDTGHCTTKGHWWDIPRPYDYWTYEYLVRSQQWLRKKVVEFIEKQKPNLPEGGKCTIMHVRRGDIILHKVVSYTREYLPISAYLERLPEERKARGSKIILLTDDQNAIDEAHEFFPDINWFHFDRKRFRGTEGGFEKHLPSLNPADEVTAILATLEIVQMCDGIARQKSNLGDLMVKTMREVHGPNFEDYFLGGYRYGKNQTRSSNEALSRELQKEREKRNAGLTKV